MRNFIQTGHLVSVTAPTTVKSGDIVVVGALFGVAATDAESGDPVAIGTEGVFSLPKISAQAWAQGAAVYLDGDTGLLTTDHAEGPLIGVALASAANPSSHGTVRLVPGFGVASAAGLAALEGVVAGLD